MAQHDYTIANQGFPAFRSDLNNALAAIVSNNSGATEPTTMFAHQMWVDTAADPSVLKIRNADNDAWITIGTINQTGDTFTLTSAVSATTLNTSGAVVFNDAGADVDFRVEGDTDANLLFVDAGNDRVGIGTSSPATKLHVNQTNDALPALQLQHNDGDFILMEEGGGTDIFKFTRVAATNDLQVNVITAANLRFATNNTERMRIDSSGTVGINTTGASTNYKLVVNAAALSTGAMQVNGAQGAACTYMISPSNGGAAAVLNHEASAGTTYKLITGFHGVFGVSATESFIVYNNGNVLNTNNSYGQISDIKTKQDIVDAASQWDDIKNIRVRKFRFKNNPTEPLQIGVVAQELEEISPGLIDEHPDFEEVTKTREVEKTRVVTEAVLDEDGNEIEPAVTETYTEEEEYTESVALDTTTKSVKYSVLYMKAVKALQEAMERIETLEAKVAALENA